MYRAIDIANFIVKIALSERVYVTNLHLQKTLYFLQVNELVYHNQELFSDEIEKWKLGPVVVNVYNQYKGYGSTPISEIPKYYSFNEKLMELELKEYDLTIIDQFVRDRIKPIILNILNIDQYQLVDECLSHEPWIKDFDKIHNHTEKPSYNRWELINYFEENIDKLDKIIKK